MIRVLLISLIMASAATAWAQGNAPTIEVALDPSEPVTVGTPVKVTVTVLVPTYMPDPPNWPDLQIADAITRMPDRATATVTRRIERKSWSGLRRTYEITPQRAADFSLNGAVVTVTYTDPDSHEPRQADLPMPDVRISAVLPQGAEGLDPFIAAQSLTLSAAIDGMPDDPKPGDAFTLTLTTTATGTQAMLLPPLSDRIPIPQGLRAYPRQPELSDPPGNGGAAPTATRKEEIAFVVEAAVSYVLPALSLDWWNTGTSTVDTASTNRIDFAVRDTLGHQAVEAARSGNPFVLLAAALAAIGIAAGLGLIWRRYRHRKRNPGPSEKHLYRQLCQTVRDGPVETIRPQLRLWLSVVSPTDPAPTHEIEMHLHRLERAVYGPNLTPPEDAARTQLLAAISERRREGRAQHDAAPALPGLNPDWSGTSNPVGGRAFR